MGDGIQFSRIVRRGLIGALWSLGALSAIVLVWHMLYGLDIGSETSGAFDARHLGESYNIDDLGIADLDGDGALDIFTTNHRLPQFLRFNDGAGSFRLVSAADLGLGMDQRFPGAMSRAHRPAISEPGLYIYYYRRSLVFDAVGVGKTSVFAGTVDVGGTVYDRQRGNVHLERDNYRTDAGVRRSRIRFVIEGSGRLEFEDWPPRAAGFKELTLAPDIPLESVHIGEAGQHPSAHDDVWPTLRDRHSVVWSDFYGDGFLDAFITVGGARGRLSRHAPETTDEVFAGAAPGAFERDETVLGLEKRGCPARQIATVDLNGDNRLDLYIACGREDDPNRDFPNQLFVQQPDGRFRDVAAAVGLDIPEMGAFAFGDVDEDGDPDLIYAFRGSIWLYRNEAGHFAAERLGSEPKDGWQAATIVRLADYQNDGDLDAFVASAIGSAFALNEDGAFRMIDLQTLGLPAKAVSANWVDYDNDGLLDLFVAPSGLYRQLPDGAFKKTGMLAASNGFMVHGARSSWTDVDDDGALDLILGSQKCLPLRACSAQKKLFGWARRILGSALITPFEVNLDHTLDWRVELYRQNASLGNWLHIDLAGPAGNSAGLGTRVVVGSGGKRQMQVVGQSEGSHLSQGHYRLYFGLGEAQEADAIEVVWPDGTRQTLSGVAGNRRLTIAYGKQSDKERRP